MPIGVDLYALPFPRCGHSLAILEITGYQKTKSGSRYVCAARPTQDETTL